MITELTLMAPKGYEFVVGKTKTEIYLVRDGIVQSAFNAESCEVRIRSYSK